ncbi:outer membrane protein assembly factor BamB family protein [Cellulomonas soli]|uniref:Pyrrolo-quinoline quinone repeat domain-containing protein n=1 Tax=Cellulomonas soli TaxID=931535 RepID=A0A512PEU0_9CELL|nr:PQQ-binding-like beta-propeller repeat protein [Cellulomonas soli]NYI59481.1 outer membrane protein assembly factor BamB [Cellulomonas soli]GEP69727.1 hypothetical protein CSO01_24420 [Cellulomonas soli]
MGGMADVELIEDGEHPRGARRTDAATQGADKAVAVTGPDASAAGSPPDQQRRRLRRLALGGVGVLVAGLVVTQQVVDARERARLTQYAEVPGVLAPVRSDAQELWRASPETDAAFAQRTVPTLVGDVLLGGTVATDGLLTLGAMDPDTGRSLWSVAVTMPGDPPPAQNPAWVSCQEPTAAASPASPAAAPPPGGTAVCTVEVPQQTVEITTSDGGTYQSFVGRAALLLVATATGEVLERVDTPLGTDVAAAPGGYVTVTPDVVLDPAWNEPEDVPDGGLTIARYAWGATSPRWTSRTPVQDYAVDQSWAAADARQVAVRSGGTVWLIDAADGSLLGSLAGTDGYSGSTSALPGGGVVSSYFGGTGPTSRMLTADGTTVDLKGLTTVTRIADDGSAPDLVLMAQMNQDWSRGTLVALDARTGEERWRSETTSGWSVVVLGGVVYTADEDELAALDARDGSARWTHELEHGGDAQLLTDGSSAILAGQGRVDAYDLRDGEPLWSSLVVRSGESVGLQPVTDGPTAAATAGTTVSQSWVTTVGRHLALMSQTGEVTVLG